LIINTLQIVHMKNCAARKIKR